MLYDGKKPEELTKDELEAAAVYCTRMKHQAAMIFEMNDAGLEELSEECARRGIVLHITYEPEALN